MTTREARRAFRRNMRAVHRQSSELAKLMPAVEVPPADDPTVVALRKMVRLQRSYQMVVR
jgi:hypothetical protein